MIISHMYCWPGKALYSGILRVVNQKVVILRPV